MGHEVHLIDPVPKHVQEAKNISVKSGKPLASIAVGEARDLEFEDGYFNVVLLMGPLYHLTERKERMRALSEARRCLCQDGLLFGAGISRYASMLDGYFRNLIKDPEFLEIMNRDLKDGQHRNPTNDPSYFTTAYLYLPEDLRKEILETSFKLEALLAIDSFGWLLPDFDENWRDAQFRELLLQSIRACENEPSMIGLSAHIMSVATK
jgi:SAM-dependent methyltransferase